MRERVRNAGAARKFRGAIREHFGFGIAAGQRGNYISQGLRQQNVGSEIANFRIGIGGQNAEGFDAVVRLKQRRFVANCELTFECCITQTDFIAKDFVNCRLRGLLLKNRA